MNNEEILKTRWKNIDKYLLEYLKDYLKVNRETRDQIQNVFNEMNIEYKDINKLVSKEQKNKLNRFILKLKEKGLLTGYFGYMARLIYSKKNVTYLEMLNIMIMACYIEQNDELDEYNNLLFYKVCKDSYEQAMKDIEKIKKIDPISFKIPILYTILNIPIFNTTIESYLYSLALTNSEELIKQTLINMQLGKKLNVDNKMYTSLFDKQNKRYININDDKISGGITNIVENITNLGYLQAGKDTNTTECRFIAEMDKRTTQMCETLNNQIFKIDEMNVYQRYSDIDKKIVTYHTKGLIIGENLPPINNHFHWCRSTITYQLKKDDSGNKYSVITKKWLSKSFINRNAKVLIPNQNDIFNYHGTKYKIDNKNVVIDYNSKEFTFANWLAKKINKKVSILPRINYPTGIKTPDYKINDMYFDLKSINGTSNQVLYHAIRKKELQARNFAFDITNSSLEISDIFEQVNSIYSRKDTEWVEIIILKKCDDIIIFEKNKRNG